jgi:ABC-type dipeptide/oligopeptide/nickel transport system permease component
MTAVAVSGDQVSILEVLKKQRWWLARVLVLPVHLFFFAAAVFFLVRMIPGDPVAVLTGGQNVSAAKIAQIREALGLSGSMVDQFGHYLHNVVTLHFGNSMVTGTPVWTEISQRLPATIELAVTAMLIATGLTVVMGLTAVLKPKSILAKIVVPYGRTAGAIPDFVLGVLGIFVLYTTLHLLPAPSGLTDPTLTPDKSVTGFPLLDAVIAGDTTMFWSIVGHLILPVAVLVIAYTPLLLKIFLRALEEAVDAPPTRFRIAAGASRRTVLLSVARRAAPSAVAMLGTLFGFMLGGVVVEEQLFAMPGMGLYGVTAVNTSDRLALEAFLIVVAAISLVVFLIVDLINMVLDPRRRPGLAKDGSS